MVSLRHEGHEQDGERLPRRVRRSASGDPAMTFQPFGRPRRPQAPGHTLRPDNGGGGTAPSAHNAREQTNNFAQIDSATNSELLDQYLVARFIGALEVVEQLATLRYKLQKSPPGVVVLDVRLEMLGQ